MEPAAVNRLASERWRAEVASLLEAAPELAPAARAAVLTVLRSLEGDPASDQETLADVRLLLDALAETSAEGHRARELFARIGQRLAVELAA